MTAFDRGMQELCMAWFLRVPESGVVLTCSDDSLFDFSDLKFIFNVVKSFRNKFSFCPSKVVFKDYVATSFPMSFDVAVAETVERIYALDDTDFPYVAVRAKEEIAKRRISAFVFSSYAKLSSGASFSRQDVDSLVSDLGKMDSVAETRVGFDGLYLFSDFASSFRRPEKVVKTKFKDLNACFNAGGISAGEIVVFMASPKGGKTTMLVNLAMGFVMDGQKVLYLDTENGVNRIRKMCFQNMLKCTSAEIYRLFEYMRRPEVYDELVAWDAEALASDSFASDFVPPSSSFGKDRPARMLYDLFVSRVRKAKLYEKGEIRVDYVPPGTCTVAEVEKRLEYYEKEHQFLPDVVVCDYFDNMFSGKKNLERRFEIREIYLAWKALAEKRKFPVVTVSQVNRAGIDKANFSAADIAEDIGKAANADAIIGISRTKEEKEAGKGRLETVLMREGRDGETVFLNFYPEICLVSDFEYTGTPKYDLD
jgi:hypothetical protein